MTSCTSLISSLTINIRPVSLLRILQILNCVLGLNTMDTPRALVSPNLLSHEEINRTVVHTQLPMVAVHL